jgi:hypothetical protein
MEECGACVSDFEGVARFPVDEPFTDSNQGRIRHPIILRPALNRLPQELDGRDAAFDLLTLEVRHRRYLSRRIENAHGAADDGGDVLN